MPQISLLRGVGSDADQHPIKLLCGAITDSAHDGWRDAAADNGLFEVCDGLSYHSYRPSQDEEKLAAVFRNWLESRDGHGDFPLMVTPQPLLISRSTGSRKRACLLCADHRGRHAERRLEGLVRRQMLSRQAAVPGRVLLLQRRVRWQDAADARRKPPRHFWRLGCILLRNVSGGRKA